jgi:hypothetical protein
MCDIIYIFIIALVISENQIYKHVRKYIKNLTIIFKYVMFLHTLITRFDYFMQCICKKLI